MTPEELKTRTKQFGLSVIRFIRTLPRTEEARVIGRQLLRSGTGVGANYRGTCRCKSDPDFISKMGTVEEEADESGFWLEMLKDVLQMRSPKSESRTSGFSRPELRQSQMDIHNPQALERLLDEANQLVAIVVASRKTARGSGL